MKAMVDNDKTPGPAKTTLDHFAEFRSNYFLAEYHKGYVETDNQRRWMKAIVDDMLRGRGHG